MSGLNVDAVVIPGHLAERVDYPADSIWLRAVGHGDIQVADYTSTDRDGPPAHSHPWDEAQIVVDGEVEFLVGDSWKGGGSGTVQLLPRGVPHSVRVPAGTADHPGVHRSALRRLCPGCGTAVRRRCLADGDRGSCWSPRCDVGVIRARDTDDAPASVKPRV